jgi:hypothetical protein
MLFAKLSRLLLRCTLQSSGQQTAYGRHADILHLGQINVQAGTLFAPLLLDDDFSPALCQFLDPLEIFRCQLPCSHVASLQQVMSLSPDQILP